MPTPSQIQTLEQFTGEKFALSWEFLEQKVWRKIMGFASPDVSKNFYDALNANDKEKAAEVLAEAIKEMF